MPYNNYLSERVCQILKDKHIAFVEKKMMGGLCILVKEKMLLGIIKDKLMARVGEEAYASALMKKGAHEMDFTGKPMKGYVFVELEGLDTEEDFEYWVQLCLDFNPKAVSSKK